MNQPTDSGPRHVSVLAAEVLAFLEPKPGEIFVDATVGAGGHARMLAEKLAPDGRLIGLDQDPTMLALARPGLEGLPVTLVCSSFERLDSVLDELGVDKVDGLLADLGICSDQLDDPQRGLSFSRPGPLDMRLCPEGGETAGDLLKRLSERDLADVIYQYGEERFSRRIARKIVERRKEAPLETTEELAELVRRCVPRSGGKGKRHSIDPATRVFQALRIAVNDELGARAVVEDSAGSHEAGRPSGDHQFSFAGGPAGQTGVSRQDILARSDAEARAGRRGRRAKQSA